jgi:PKD repeat protein
MKRYFTPITVMIVSLGFFLAGHSVYSQKFSYPDAWSAAGMTLKSTSPAVVEVNYSIREFTLEDRVINGEPMKSVSLPGTFLFNDEGAPDLAGLGRYIAIPQGSQPRLKILSFRTETLHHVNIAPAPRIPKENEDGPLQYNKNPDIYAKNAFYPEKPIKISSKMKIRGVDVVILGVTPFQYNPVTKDLIVYRDVKIRIEFDGGNGHFGEDRLRSRFWDPILEDQLLNYSALPVIDYNARVPSVTETPGYEYMIICPNGAAFQQWADSIRRFRQQQGISTTVRTMSDVGGNTTATIEAYINNAYNNWTPPPAAVLLLGDYGTDADSKVISPIWNSYCVSDNIYGDVDGDDLPDVCMSRITANNAAQLQVMVSKFLNYERTPPTSASFYNHPITALGWQTERWFQLCSEIVGGFWKYVQGKDPVRINSVYIGNPASDPWSTATNTSTIISYFGPSGLNYIPSTPQQMPCCWTGGNAAQINSAINAGAFCILHRDHGAETGWGEPAYYSSDIDGLTNTNLTFVFSINCLTGKYNLSSECFAEKFHRYTHSGYNSGALGLIAASEVSYSFVNDTFLWGMMDNFWTNFMPAYGTNPSSRGFLPCFGNAAGKYFLQQSNWPYNSGDKTVTYHLFHHHGDAFSVVYSEVPQNLTVYHNSTIPAGATSFDVTANAGSKICLTLNDEIQGVADGTGSPVSITIPGTQTTGQNIRVTVTKQNYFRYTALVAVVAPGGPLPEFTADSTSICAGQNVDFTDLSTGTPISWNWTFPGGTPGSSTAQNPQNIVYSTPGTYNVTLMVSDGIYNNSLTKYNYITVSTSAPAPEEPIGDSLLCQNNSNSLYRINPIAGAIGYEWVLTPDSAGLLTDYDTAVIVDWSNTYSGFAGIKVQAINGCGAGPFSPERQVELLPSPDIPGQPEGPDAVCQGEVSTLYTIDAAGYADYYIWDLFPTSAGSISGSGTTGTVEWNPSFLGTATVRVKSANMCYQSDWSDALNVTMSTTPTVFLGNDTSVCAYATVLLDAGNPGASYLWSTGETTQTIVADSTGIGIGTGIFSVMVTKDGCEGSDEILITFDVCAGTAISSGNFSARIYPNPNNGTFRLELSSPKPGPVRLKIMTPAGILLMDKKETMSSEKYIHTFDCTAWSSGVYYLKIESEAGSVTKKIVISR